MRNNNKKVRLVFIGLLANLLIYLSSIAQAPEGFQYQAVLRDGSGNVITSTSVGIQISILQASTSGSPVYVETFTPATNGFGLINLNIGSGTVVSGTFATIDWSANTYFIKVELDASGGTSYVEMGTSQLLSVPYALHAKTAGNVFSGNYNDLSNTPTTVSSFTNDAGYVTGTAVFSGNYNDLTNKPTAVSAFTNDAGYLTAEVDGSVTNEIQDLSLASNILTVTNNASATNINLAPYLDNTDNQTLSGILTSNNSAGSNNITNLADAVNPQDAVTKIYVDSLKARIASLESVPGVVKDFERNMYATIKIGDQIWMAENLKATLYADGTAITGVSDYASTPANSVIFGKLYTWAAVMNGASSSTADPSGVQGVCPNGWHLPSDAEWTTLQTYLGGSSVAGGAMKEKGDVYWVSNVGATNSSGFTGYGGGWEWSGYAGLYDSGVFWSTVESDASNAWYWILSKLNAGFARSGSASPKTSSFSVRCVKD